MELGTGEFARSTDEQTARNNRTTPSEEVIVMQYPAVSTLAARFEQAQQLAEQGNLPAALDLFAECAAADPGRADFVDCWLDALQQHQPAGPLEDRPAAFAALANLSQEERWDEVLQQGQLLLRDFPRRVPLLQTLATASASLGYFESADCYLATALDLEPTNVDLLRQRAKLLAQMRRYDEALQTWMQLERVSPDDPGAAGAIASLAIERSRRRNNLKRRSEDFRATEPKPRVRLKLKQPSTDRVFGSLATPTPIPPSPVQRTQIQELELAVREFPSHAENYVQLAQLYLEKGRDLDAERLLNRGRAATDNHPQVVQLWEEVATRMMEERVAQARRDAAENPSAASQTALAQVLRERDKLETAVYSSRLQREPDNLALQYELGVRLKRSAKLREAMKHLELALHDNVVKALAAFELGECQLQLGDVPQAMRYYRMASENALAEQAMCRKAALYQASVLALRMKMYKNAARYLRELVRVDPKFRDAATLLQNIQPNLMESPVTPTERRVSSSSPTV
jgi:tetratricopeptide (TPR) repeat protein